MKKIIVAVLALLCAASLCYAADESAAASSKATEPVGALVEATGVYVGNIASIAVQGTTQGKVNGLMTVSDEKGTTKIFPLDETVKVVDTTLNTLTLNQLKKGEKVSVEYSKDQSGQEKAKTINVVQ